jgi:hypothetical protein
MQAFARLQRHSRNNTLICTQSLRRQSKGASTNKRGRTVNCGTGQWP